MQLVAAIAALIAFVPALLLFDALTLGFVSGTSILRAVTGGRRGALPHT